MVWKRKSTEDRMQVRALEEWLLVLLRGCEALLWAGYEDKDTVSCSRSRLVWPVPHGMSEMGLVWRLDVYGEEDGDEEKVERGGVEKELCLDDIDKEEEDEDDDSSKTKPFVNLGNIEKRKTCKS